MSSWYERQQLKASSRPPYAPPKAAPPTVTLRSTTTLMPGPRGKARTQAVYEYIVLMKLTNDGQAPTIREIGMEVGISSTSVVQFHLRKLENFGLIARETNGARDIQIRGGSWHFDDQQIYDEGFWESPEARSEFIARITDL